MDITKYKNWYIMIKIYNNITFVVKFLVVKKVFKEMLNYSLEDNSKILNITLFQKKIKVVAKSFFLQNYICQVQKNWK